MRAGDNLDPDKVWATLMTNEKPGGHGERSVAVGTIDMAVWDAVAKIAGKPLFRLLAERHGREANPRVFVYAAGGYYYPGKDLSALRGEMRGYLDRGYTVVKMKIGGAPIAEDRERIEAVLEGDRQGRAARGRCQRPLRSGDRDRLRQDAAATIRCSGTRRPAIRSTIALQAALAEFYPGPMATGENLFSHQDARNLMRYGGMRPDRDWLQFDCALSYGLCEYQRTLAVLKTHGWSPRRCIPHGGHQMSLNIAAGLGLGGNESYPDLFQPYGGFPGRRARRERPHHHAGTAGHRLRGQVRSLHGDEGAGGVKGISGRQFTNQRSQRMPRSCPANLLFPNSRSPRTRSGSCFSKGSTTAPCR